MTLSSSPGESKVQTGEQHIAEIRARIEAVGAWVFRHDFENFSGTTLYPRREEMSLIARAPEDMTFLLVQLDAANDIIARFAQHSDDCRYHHGRGCTCGFSEAMTSEAPSSSVPSTGGEL